MPATSNLVYRTAILALSAVVLAVHSNAVAQELPVPCSGAACGASGPATWVTDGSVTGSIAGNSFNIQQNSQSATLNWASFNIGADGVVNFTQPNSTAVAINNIFQADPSRIFGALNANGQVYLLNQNGILFGASATVDVGGMVASSLTLTNAAIENGIAGAARQNSPAFVAFVDELGQPLPSGAITVEDGAFLGAEGGQIFLFAPEVVNRGTISTPDGQSILAAGNTVYLAASQDDNLRGLIVEVNGEGVATNGDTANATRTDADLIGQIMADRGNVTIAGLAVNQLGRVSATTSVRQNGSIRLVSRRNQTVISTPIGVNFVPVDGGAVVIGENSVTEVTLETASEETTVDVNAQPRSQISVGGATIDVLDGAQIRAPAGDVRLIARRNPLLDPTLFAAEPDDTRVYIGDDVVVDVSGATIERSVSDNIIEVELRGNQLADSPEQRDGDIRSETVLVDIRQRGVRADGSEWQGTPLADASGEISNIERTVAERSLSGGNIDLASQGTVYVAQSANLDISGGVATYNGGDVTTSRLLGADGRLYDIADADRDRTYVRIVDSFVVEHPRWGVTEVFEGFQPSGAGVFEQGYTEGYDAGRVSLIAPQFVLDGAITATTAAGRYQRNLPGPLPDVGLYRSFDELPIGGTLLLGSSAGAGAQPNYVLGNVRLGISPILSALRGESGPIFNPLEDTLPADFVSSIRTELFGQGRVTNAQIFANETIEFVASETLSLPAASTIALTASEIIFGVDVTAPSGTLDLAVGLTAANPDSRRIELQTGTDIDLSGQWVNDNPQLGSATAPIAIDGGQASVQVEFGDLLLASGSTIDVSGGAYVDALAGLQAGSAGSVAVDVSPGDGATPVDVVVDAELRAFSVGIGGSLAITTNLICIAAQNCSDDDGELWLDAAALFSNGFSDVTLASNLLGIEIVPGTQIQATQQSIVLPEAISGIPTGTPLDTFTSVARLPEIVRNPVALTLSANTSADPQLNLEEFSSEQGLRLGRLSRIDADPFSTVNLTSNAAISIDGTIFAPSGTIELLLSSDLTRLVERPDGFIELADGAALDVSGAVRSQLDSLQRRIGTVFDAGLVSITAERDGVVLQPGSIIRANGSSADLTVRTGTANNPGFEDRRVGSNAGVISLAAGDYIVASGEFEAFGGDVPGTADGSLNVVFDALLRGTDPGGRFGDPILSINSRRIVLSPELPTIGLDIDRPVPDDFLGRAVFGVDQLERAGFDNVQFRAETLFSLRNGVPFLASFGEILLNDGVDLQVDGLLSFDAPTLLGSGDVSLQSNVFRLGHQLTRSQAIPGEPTLTASAGGLAISANLIDLIGAQRIDGFETISLSSSGDIRVTGIQEESDRRLSGLLATNSDLLFDAVQIYPTTLSDYRFEVSGDTARIDIRARAGEAGPVYSAAGSVEFLASTINQAGIVRAPNGSVSFIGEDVTLAPGSLTSTSLDDTLVPFGALQGGLDWTYSLARNQTLVFDNELNVLPEQQVEISADNINLAESAVVDVSAGGDLLAYEWIPGIGGSTDYLSAAESPNLFAILPGVELNYAPYDFAESGQIGFGVGDAVFLEGAGELAAGVYTLLPPRYAILPGAVLVTPVEGYQDILPGETFPGLDNSVVIAGRAAINGTDVLGTRTQGFALIPRQQAFAEAQYTLAVASTFFADSGFRTPLDAGIVSLAAQASLSLEGDLLADFQRRGAGVDIASQFLRIVDAPTGSDDFVEIDAAQLNALGAESVLLGGRRSVEGDSTRIAIATVDLDISPGAELTAPELLFVAEGQISVGSGATIAANGVSNARGDLTLSGDSAFLGVSSGGLRRVVRDDIQGLSGDVLLASGARLSAGGSVSINAARSAASEAELDIAGADLSLAASAIILGDAPAETSGLVVTSAEIDAAAPATLELISREDLQLFGSVELAVDDSLSISAPAIVADLDASLRLSSNSVSLFGRGENNDIAVPGTASFEIVSDTLWLNGGELTISGFDSLGLSSETIVAAGDGNLQTAASIVADTSLFSVASGIEFGIRTDARLETRQAQGGPPESPGGFGGRLTLSAGDLLVDSTIESRSGQILLEATGPNGTLRLGNSAVLNTSGSEFTFDDVVVGSPGGDVELTATFGDILVQSDARIDVSGPTGALAGAFRVFAPQGAIDVTGSVDASGDGGGIYIDGDSIRDSAALLDLAAGAGFSGAISVRQRGPGDIVVDTDQGLTAERILLQADSGNVHVDGTIRLEGPLGRRLDLVASDSVFVDGLITVADTEGNVSATLNLESETGGIFTGVSSVIELADNADLWLRAAREAFTSLTNPDAGDNRLSFSGRISGSGRIFAEGRQQYDVVDGQIGSADVQAVATNPWFNDAATFMAGAEEITAALGFAGDDRFRLLPGVALRNDGDITLTSDFNLFNWRFNTDTPGVLTIQAGGDLLLDASISDAFLSTFFNELTFSGDSWSYRLTAGADLNSANPLSVVADDTAGSLVVGPGILRQGLIPPIPNVVRTGNGDIDIAAATDIRLGNAVSAIYTAGIARDGVFLLLPGDLGFRLYPDQGGNVSLSAGRDIVGVASNQLFSSWLYRAGRSDRTPIPAATGWTINFGEFQQNSGALGGGFVDIAAGRDIVNFSANVPTVARQTGGMSFAENEFEIIAGGNLRVSAGRDLLGGSYSIGRGAGRIDVDRSFAADAEGIAPVIGLGEGSFDIVGLDDVAIAAVVNPTLIPQDPLQEALDSAVRSFISTYADDSRLSLLSVGGNTSTQGLDSTGISRLLDRYSAPNFFNGDELTLRLAPPVLSAASLTGDVNLAGSITLYPSAQSNLTLLAAKDVNLGTELSGIRLLLSDVAPDTLPSPDQPINSIVDFFGQILSNPNTLLPEFNASIPVHIDDPNPLRIVARDGDVRILGSGAGSPFVYSAKPVRVLAGRDIVSLTLLIQHANPNDVSSLQAGRDIVFPTARANQGLLAANNAEITVEGPGYLQLASGRDIDFQSSTGVTTEGNINNPALVDGGASVSLIAGLGSLQPQYDAFVNRYLVDSDDYNEVLIDFLADRVGVTVASKDAALTAFSSIDVDLQRVLIERVFFDELRLSGREAAQPGPQNQDFSRGFVALETLFPGSNPDVDAGEENAYSGDVRLFFSRVYTLDDGDIRILVPGGEINAGLATPPAAFGIAKEPAQLGVVVQGSGNVEGFSFDDFAVNESRVFAADGGDILIWSTRGDIDAGRGAKTAISAPPPEITIDPVTGTTQLSFPAALTGSGIQTLATTPGVDPGNVDLFAPRGVVNAGDAGIVAGNLTIAAVAVLGADNIQVSGISVGVPTQSVPTAGLGNASSVASSAQNTAQAAAVPQGSDEESSTPLADQALGFLDVFILGFGDCNPETGEGCEGP